MDLSGLGEIGEYESVKYCIDNYCIPNNKPIIFFEVGVCNGNTSSGFYSMISNNKRDDNKYFAFEPYEKNYHKILCNDNFPKDESGVFLIKKAIYSKTGILNLFCSYGKAPNNPNEYDGCSSLLEPKEVIVKFPFIKFNNESVEAITIDDFCVDNNIDEIDFIFADIQGAEGEMIKGAKNMISKIKFMFLEKSDKDVLYNKQPLTKDLVGIMNGLGFEVAKIFGCDILFYNTKLV